ncbi:STAS domain-containing protein [Streptomyces sp. NPDC020807]|uniref:STAS domain-containing protein n=1 Tax=Streptomyces sp. NPDC020807 TaxID=3155119 RepID=UPI0033D2909B
MTTRFDSLLPAAAAKRAGDALLSSIVAVVVEPGPLRSLARVYGEIDLDDADGLRRDLAAALDSSREGLDVDLSGVIFCDSQGLHLLVDLHHRALGAGKSLVLTALSRPVARLVDVTGAREVLTTGP